MAKPTIVTRAGKGSALTWTEGDANLTNLRDATITVTDGTNSKALNLNDTLSFTAGTNMTVAVNSSTGAVTISTSATTNTGTVTSVAALTLGTSGSDVSSTVANGTTTPVITLNIPTASASNRGALSSTDWSTFNGKQAALVSGTSIKTVNNTSLLGSGDVGTIGLGYGGTGATSAPAAMASLMGFTTTATAAGTTTLTNASSYYQVFTGSTTQTVKLPATSTLATGWSFHICNNSSGNLTLQTNTAAAMTTILPGTTVMATCVSVAGDTAAAWEYGFTDFSTATGTGDVVLSASPTLTGTLTAAAITSTGALNFKQPVETIYDNGNSGAATITPNAANGSVQKYTLTGNITWSAFGTPVAGQSITMILIQDATGGRTLTSTIKWAGASKTLSTAANAIDIATVYYDGTNYYGSLAKGFA